MCVFLNRINLCGLKALSTPEACVHFPPLCPRIWDRCFKLNELKTVFSCHKYSALGYGFLKESDLRFTLFLVPCSKLNHVLQQTVRSSSSHRGVSEIGSHIEFHHVSML